MGKAMTAKSARIASSDSQTASTIRFNAILHRPAPAPNSQRLGSWTFLNLPKKASAKLSSRGQTSVQGSINGVAIRATFEPDGQGGHWLKVDRKLREAAGAQPGDIVTLEVTPLTPDKEPEPKVPADLRRALADAPRKAREVWSDITPIARRDWIHWIASAKQAETRARRIRTCCDMLAKGKRRPCCFDRSGMYGKSMTCPIADEQASRE